jgi:hypothetical protein
MEIHFLSASVPLTKTFFLNDKGEIEKNPYPSVGRMTSHIEQAKTPTEFYKAVVAHAAKGHCLFKGKLIRQLTNESRKNTHIHGGETQWVCLDFDRYRCASVDEALTTLGLNDITYVVQYSSSHMTAGTAGTISCHVFMLLSAPMPAPLIKLWLQGLNLKHYSDQMSLSSDNATLRWPLDITTCQNDKLIYIAPPIFKDSIPNPLKVRTELVKHKLTTLPIERMGYDAPEILKKKMSAKLNELRAAKGFNPIKAATKFIGDLEIRTKPGEAVITGIREDEDYVRLNINDSKSWAYWHFKDNFELIYTFKDTSIAFYTKELLPAYYAQKIAEREAANAAPTTEGDIVLGFRDAKSASYWNGLWNEGTNTLVLHRARSEVQIDHWLKSYGKTLGDFIPIWNMEYLPKEDWVIDMENKRINMFQRSEYMINAVPQDLNLESSCPLIYRTIFSLVGSDKKVMDEFINWFACLFQRIGKPLTCWTFHGIEGTGKGAFFNYIARPLLHPSNVMPIGMTEAQDNFNGFLKNKLLVYNDEIDVDAFTEKGIVTAKYRIYITEPTVTIREMQTVSHTVPNTFGMIFASNKRQPVWIPPTDRRYNIGLYQHKKLIISDTEVKEGIALELQDFANYLTNYAASLSRASQIVDTADRRRIAKLAVTSIQETADAIINGDLEQLWSSMPDEAHLAELATMTTHMAYASAYAVLIRKITADLLSNEKHYEKLTREEIRTIFQYCCGNTPETPNKFTALLRHCGIETKRIKRLGNMAYGVEVQWHISPEFRKHLIEMQESATEKKKLTFKTPKVKSTAPLKAVK